ncbi:MAG TPA: AAA family ATPase [Baekduia sp.]|nr:AAA family ATPase [Baekduia sp.]
MPLRLRSGDPVSDRELRSLPGLLANGYADPLVPVMEGSRHAPLVGRRQELASLVAELEGLRSADTRWLTVSGEPGTGKTRVLAELCAAAEARGCAVLIGRGAEMERELPFGVWVDALDDHVAALGPERLEALVGDRVVELSRILPSAGGGAPVGGLQDERFRAHRAVRALLQQMATRHPVVLMLDDVHWADDASLELLAHLLRRPAPARILIALAFRVGQLPTALLAALEAASHYSSVTEMRLTPLSPSEADELIGEELPAHQRQLIYRQSGGNPFYLQELARAPRRLLDKLPHGDGIVGVPAAVAAALAQEIGGLSQLSRTLAWGAAVAGDPIDLDLAAATAGLPEDEALGAVDDLLVRDVLRPTAVSRRYRFRHPIVRRAVYEAAGEAWRLRAHARAAAALAGRPSAIVARAHHVERSARVGDEQAVALLEQAARQSAARAPAVAAGWLTAALRLLPDVPDQDGTRRLGMLVELASALAATGRLAGALDALQEALALVPPPLAELRVRLIAACAACENPLGRHDAAHARLLRALDDVADHGSTVAASLQVELAVDALYDSDFLAMREWARAAAETARTLGERGLCAVAEGLLCFAGYGLGQARPAEAARLASAAGLDALTDEELAARLDAPHYLGFAEFFCEQYADAARHFRRGIAVSRVVGQGQFVVQMMVGLAHALERLGQLREALTTAEAAVEAARLGGNQQIIGFALVAEAWTAAAWGDIYHAETAAEEAVALLEGLDESVLTRATHAHVGVMWLEIGEPARCIEQLRAIGLPDFPLIEPGRRGWLYAVLARAQLELGDRDAAAEWVARSETTVQGLGLPLAEAWALHARALITLADGDATGAAELALRAAQRADTVQVPVPAARCRTLAGIALATAGQRQQAVRLLTRAEAELAACDASRFRDEAARELRRLGQRVATRQRRTGHGQGLDALSGRELEIAEKVALGRTNREIAGELFLSEKTVESHLTSVFNKLSVSSRAAVAEAVGRSHTPGG